MNKTVGSVLDDINEWNGPNGTIYYVTAFFTDESVGSVGKKEHDAALEVQGLLREAIEVEMDYTLEDKGLTKTGKQKWNIKGIGSVDGAPIYTAPGAPGGGAPSVSGGTRSHSPEYIVDPYKVRDASITRAVALKAAAIAAQGLDSKRILVMAEEFETWLKASEPAPSAYRTESSVEEASPLKAHQADAGSESGEEVGESMVDQALGEGTPASPHIHDWQPHPQLRGKLKCDCGMMRKKEEV